MFLFCSNIAAAFNQSIFQEWVAAAAAPQTRGRDLPLDGLERITDPRKHPIDGFVNGKA